MDQRSFQSLLRRAVALPVILLVCLAAILATEVMLLSGSLRWLDHSDKVIAYARQLARDVSEMDTGLRGYFLSDDKSFLQNYLEAKARIPGQIDLLSQSSTDNPEQQERVEDIRDAVLAWMLWADQQLSHPHKGGPSDSAMLVSHKLMEDIRYKERLFAGAEEAVLMRRSHRAELLNAAVSGTAIGLSLFIAILLFTLTRREILALSSSYERHLRAEAEQRQQLTESRESFQSTLNSLGEAVISTDRLGRISYINPVAQQLTGWDYSEATGMAFDAVVHLSDERMKGPVENPTEAVTRDKNVISLSSVVLTSRGGAIHPIELTGAPILDRRGQVLGVTVVFRDVAQRRQTEQTLRSSERLTMAGRLSATIAHEIRNPLDTVSNLVYLLQHESPSPAQAQYLSLASEELTRIAQITSQLLTFHRESRSPVAVNLNEVLESVLVLFAPQIKQNRVQVQKRFEADKNVRGFPGELRQVFSNLVGNAVEATPPDGNLVLHTRISSLASNPAVKGIRVTVLDNGSGIPTGVRKNLFAPFYTTKGEKGTGLGLWISRSIVEKHEGTIHFASRVRDGSTGTAFSVFLPFEQKHGLKDVKSAEVGG